MSIVIGHWIPAYRGNVRVEIASQMVRDFTSLSAQDEWRHFWTDTSDIVRARNDAVERSIAQGHDYLMMQDADIFSTGSPMKSLLRTSQKYDATLVSAICGLRRGTRLANADPLFPGKRYEAERVGSGMILIDVNHLRRFREEGHDGPWFARTYKDKAMTECAVGEDIFFCYLVKQLGGKVWVDGRVPTTHVHEDRNSLDYKPGTDGHGGHTAGNEKEIHVLTN